MRTQYDLILSLLNGNIMDRNGSWQSPVPLHEAITRIDTHIQTPVRSDIEDAVIFWILTDYIYRLLREILADPFPGIAKIITYVNIGLEIIVAVTVQSH